MAREKEFETLGPFLLTANGGADGLVTIADTADFKVKRTVTISANTLPNLVLQVKRVISKTQLYVGKKETGLEEKTDISAYTVALSASIFSPSQKKNNIPSADIIRSVFSEEPTLAIRSLMVDKYGRHYTVENPLPVQLSTGSISIGTVNAELEVQLSHQDNVPNPGDVADSVQVGDGVETLGINPDRSINVNIVPSNTAVEINSYFNEIIAVPSSSRTLVNSITAQIGVLTYLQKVFFSGTNIATYEVELNGTVIDKKRTWFGTDIDNCFDFEGVSRGLLLADSDVVDIYVTHNRPFVGDFNARIQTIEI